MSLLPQAVLTRNPEIFASKVDEEVVMMSEKENAYFGLNPVGGKIWELLEKPLSYEELVNRLVKVYQVEREKCAEETEVFVNQLLEHHLVKIDSPRKH